MDPAGARATLQDERARGLEAVASAATLDDLDRVRVAFLGRKAPWSEVQRSLGSFDPDARRELGRLANEVKATLDGALAERRAELEGSAEDALLQDDRVDVTLPGRRPRPGSLHPLTIVRSKIVDVFTRMGYRVAEGPEIEDDWHNFEALNIPPDHPARTMKDSLYVDVPGLLLRTETSTVPSTSSSPVACIGARPPTRPTGRCSSRSRGWRWTRASRSPISWARSR